MCSRVPLEPIWKEIISANMKYIPTCCREFGVGEAVLPVCVFISKSRLFSSFICILTCKRCLLGHFVRVFACRTCEYDDGLKLLVYYLCVGPRKHVRIRRGQWGGGSGGVVKSRTSRWLIYAQGHTQIVHLAFCPITGNIQPKGSGPISKESACNERSEARFYHRQ